MKPFDALMQVAIEAREAEEQAMRDLFRTHPVLCQANIVEEIARLIGEDDWRARAEGIKLRARIAGNFAPTDITVAPARAEDLGGFDRVFEAIPEAERKAALLALLGQVAPEIVWSETDAPQA